MKGIQSTISKELDLVWAIDFTLIYIFLLLFFLKAGGFNELFDSINVWARKTGTASKVIYNTRNYVLWFILWCMRVFSNLLHIILQGGEQQRKRGQNGKSGKLQ